MTRRLFALLFFLFLSFLVPLPAQTPAGHGLLVRIHLFSGRRDPEFRITDPAEVAEFMKVFTAHAAEDPSPGPEPILAPRLGYRGIEVIRLGEGHPALGDLAALTVNGPRIQVRHGAGAGMRLSYHRDADAALEAHLLARAKALGHLDAAMLARIHGH